jgi:hypothetical protein
LHFAGVNFIFFARLRCGQQKERLRVFVGDERVVELDALLKHVEQMVFDSAFESEHEIEIPQSHVRIDERHARTALRESAPHIRGRRSLTDPALAGR